MGQSIENLTSSNMPSLLHLLKKEAEAKSRHGYKVTALSCVTKSYLIFSPEIYTTVVYSEGVAEQSFRLISARSPADLNRYINHETQIMANCGYKLCTIASATLVKSRQDYYESILVFDKKD